ncbi:hypothetical protein LXL04_017107 [Taraxacum kok-saghyz]
MREEDDESSSAVGFSICQSMRRASVAAHSRRPLNHSTRSPSQSQRLLQFIKTMVASILLIFWGSSIGEPESQSFRWIMAAIRPLCVHTFDSMMSQLRSDNTAKTSDRRPTLSVPICEDLNSFEKNSIFLRTVDLKSKKKMVSGRIRLTNMKSRRNIRPYGLPVDLYHSHLSVSDISEGIHLQGKKPMTSSAKGRIKWGKRFRDDNLKLGFIDRAENVRENITNIPVVGLQVVLATLRLVLYDLHNQSDVEVFVLLLPFPPLSCCFKESQSPSLQRLIDDVSGVSIMNIDVHIIMAVVYRGGETHKAIQPILHSLSLCSTKYNVNMNKIMSKCYNWDEFTKHAALITKTVNGHNLEQITWVDRATECLGAIDGTHISVMYQRQIWLQVSKGNYHLVDVRYTNGEDFEGQIYHLNSFGSMTVDQKK